MYSIPPCRDVNEDFKDVPYTFVADDAFALSVNMLKPYKNIPTQQHRVFNYRISRARRMIENCFGIFANKFRIFRTTIIADVLMVEHMTKASVCLYNWLREKNSNFISQDLVDQEVNGKITPGSWRGSENWRSIPRTNRNPTTEAKLIRDRFAAYFSSDAGSVEWQLNSI